MITTEIIGELNLKSIYSNALVEDIASTTAAKVSNEFAHFIKNNRYHNYLKKDTGMTANWI